MLRYGLIALPLIEIALFVLVGRAIGVLPVLGLVLASGALGLSLMRREGVEAAMHQSEHFSPTHENVLARLADTYASTVSQIDPVQAPSAPNAIAAAI